MPSIDIFELYDDIQKSVDIIEKSTKERNGLMVPINLLKEAISEALKDKGIQLYVDAKIDTQHEHTPTERSKR